MRAQQFFTYIAFAVTFLVCLPSQAQSGIIKGIIRDELTGEPLPFAQVSFTDGKNATLTDTAGQYIIMGLEPGLYSLQASFFGYKTAYAFEIEVSNAKPALVDFKLQSDENNVVEIIISPFSRTDESPLSLRTISVSEIERYPGGNRDISKVIQSLPGVASNPTFRNDIIIRGGSPNENRFYIDGIEVPNINHFSTQGASGGPVGMINANLIKEVDVLSGAFPASRGQMLSSLFEMKLKDGRTDKRFYQFTLGASDIAGATEGFLSKNTTYIASIRRSYLQFLFQALGLPFLPTYNDFLLKTTTRLGPNADIMFFGLGAIDDFKLNTSANETEQQRYILGNLPVNTQWNYTVGSRLRLFRGANTHTFVISRNMLNNESFKYINNDESNANNLILKYKSQESENKFRYERYHKGDINVLSGLSYEYVRYYNNTFNRISFPSGIDTVQFQSLMTFHKYGAFVQLSRKFLSNRLLISAGVRIDGSSYNEETANPFRQTSPRLSASYALTKKLFLNFNTGIYYQLPAYTVLGFRNTNNEAVNQNAGVSYIRNEHVVAGLELQTGVNSKITVEGFYKWYHNYPISISTGVSLANLGGDFGVVGNEAVATDAKGRAYGIELLMQQKLYKGFFGILAYTFVRSEFGTGGTYAPSAWDNRHIVSITAGRKFKRGWDVGFRWRFSGGAPYTPYDIATSSLAANWDITGRGILDYARLNTLRLSNYHQLDVRVDKKYYLKKININFYLDIQNFYNFQAEQPPILTVERNADGTPLVDPNNPNSYVTKTLANPAGSVLPTIGIIVEF